jgi:hypothetical protein
VKTRQPEWRAIPQFDAGRWKLRLERVPLSSDNQTNDEDHPYEIGSAIRKSILPIASDDFDQTHPERNLSVSKYRSSKA